MKVKNYQFKDIVMFKRLDSPRIKSYCELSETEKEYEIITGSEYGTTFYKIYTIASPDEIAELGLKIRKF